MANLLNIQSSPDLQSSASRATSKVFVERYLSTHPNTEVTDLDLVLTPPSHVGSHHLGAFFAPPEFHTQENAAALRDSEIYLEQFLAADIIVIGTPMHNFGIASVLKSWVDNICRVGKTFKYDHTGNPIGLVSKDKKLVIIVGCGGIYSTGPMVQLDFASSYLKALFGFLGLTDITIIHAEGMTMGPDAAARGVANATEAAQAAAARA